MTMLTTPDDLKMLRETFCAAQAAVLNAPHDDARKREHAARLGHLIAAVDEQRPLGPDGKHGDLHTAWCGCDR